MRNENKSKNIIKTISGLPFFSINDLSFLAEKKYIRVVLYRYSKKGEIIRIKNGLYVSRNFLEQIERKNMLSAYREFLANKLSEPSYLSSEYVLSEYNLITEMPKKITSVSFSKTINFSNYFGSFSYRKIKKELFTGFNVFRKGEFLILKATKAKALFDFIYFRKNILINEETIKELRINTENISSKDWKEINKYVGIEGSKKMKYIFNNLKKWKY